MVGVCEKATPGGQAWHSVPTTGNRASYHAMNENSSPSSTSIEAPLIPTRVRHARLAFFASLFKTRLLNGFVCAVCSGISAFRRRRRFVGLNGPDSFVDIADWEGISVKDGNRGRLSGCSMEASSAGL